MMMSSIANAYNILVLAPFPFYSNWLYMETFIQNLLKRGHAVTSISPYRYGLKTYDNFNEISIEKYPVEELCMKFFYCLFFDKF